ncbi:MAG: prepilin peptidase [Treponema sp.]|jgi:prepilin signal peptidase PulO-like enzyme (type II secretory pathway)|nr:prepilin peptidase [Treponema sp.]
MISGTLFKFIFALFSLIIALSDIKTGAVPRFVFIIAFPFFFVLSMFQPEPHPPWTAIAGALAGLVIFLMAFLISGKKLGLADVWYSALIGLVLGPWWWYAAIGGACVAGIFYILIFKKRRIPFIPFMALGSIAVSIIKNLSFFNS